jgi:hypothetical protein
MPGSSSWMLYAPQGVKGLDDEDDLDTLIIFSKILLLNKLIILTNY